MQNIKNSMELPMQEDEIQSMFSPNEINTEAIAKLNKEKFWDTFSEFYYSQSKSKEFSDLFTKSKESIFYFSNQLSLISQTSDINEKRNIAVVDALLAEVFESQKILKKEYDLLQKKIQEKKRRNNIIIAIATIPLTLIILIISTWSFSPSDWINKIVEVLIASWDFLKNLIGAIVTLATILISLYLSAIFYMKIGRRYPDFKIKIINIIPENLIFFGIMMTSVLIAKIILSGIDSTFDTELWFSFINQNN